MPAMAAAAPKMLDLNVLLEDYAWRQLQDLEAMKKIKSEFKGIERDDVLFDVDTRRLTVLHDEPDYVNLNPTSAKPFTLFKTIFTNNTNREQEYSLKTERVTESMCLMCREQGYSIGAEAEITMKTPAEILEFKAGFKHEMNFAKADESSVTETLTWGTDSMIRVPALYETTAELVVEEMSYSGSFVLNSRLSGRVGVSIVRRRDGALVLPIAVGIAELFRELLESGGRAKDVKGQAVVERNVVRLVTKGHCSFQFAMKQRIALNERCLSKSQHTQTEPLSMSD